jgi:indole-3-glycerol phosphate synthase
MTGAAGRSADLLETIVAATRRIVEVRQQAEPLAALAERAGTTPSRAGRLQAALTRTDRCNVIAECKRRSPSRGVLRSEYDPAAIARGYEAAGAAAISVLTEPAFFDGSLEHLAAVRGAVEVPILRKDFIVSEYQLLEAKAAGADAVLLIVAALTDPEMAGLLEAAARYGVEALVEAHDADEARRAVRAGAAVIGINNRDLRTFTVDRELAVRLRAEIPPERVVVAESGIRDAADVARLRAAGVDAMLVGETLMRAPDAGASLRALLSGA